MRGVRVSNLNRIWEKTVMAVHHAGAKLLAVVHDGLDALLFPLHELLDEATRCCGVAYGIVHGGLKFRLFANHFRPS